MKSQLQQQLEAGHYVLTSEIAPPKGPDLTDFIEKARMVKGKVVAVNVTDNQRAMMRLSSLVASLILLREGIEPVLQITCRDRNRLALQSDLLGANAAGIHNVLALTGDGVNSGDQKEAKAVFDLNSVKLVQLIQKLNSGLTYNDKPLNAPSSLYIGAAVDPNLFGSDAFRSKFEQKIEQGTQFFQTQPVFDGEKFERFIEYSRQFPVKMLVGVILVKSAKQANFLNSIPGIKIPEEVIRRFEVSENPLQTGIEYAAEQIRHLRPFSHGMHLMTVGREDLVPEILRLAGC